MATLESTDLLGLDQTKVQELLLQLTTQLQELNPTLDLRRGVFHDTVSYLHAVLEAAIRTNLDRYQSARSLQQITADPTLADDELVDEVLSNWGVTRRAGSPTVGLVTIELSSPLIVTIPEGFAFESGGFDYVATGTFVSRTNPATVVVGTGDRLLRVLSNRNYAFTIEVKSVVVGTSSRLRIRDLITPVRTIPAYVTSYAAETFTGGSDTQTNQELISSLQFGIAAKTLSNRVTMQSWLTSQPGFEGLVRQSIIGYGDSEMTRDQHSIFPVSYGGRVDWYIRTQAQLQSTTVTVSATLLSKTVNTSTWQFPITSDMLPGFYEVRGIRPPTTTGLNSGFEISQETRSYLVPTDSFHPDIQNQPESAYTAYQTAIVQFADNTSNTAGMVVGQTAEYVCELVGLPLIATAQALVNNRDVRSYAADVLMKAPVPCFVSISFVLNISTGSVEIDTDSLKAAIASHINDIGFTGRLDSSLILGVIHDVLGTAVSVTNFHMVGKIRQPDGSLYFMQSTESLRVPDKSKQFVSSRTVQFFASAADIGVSVVTSLISL
jgi:hypothetical protein